MNLRARLSKSVVDKAELNGRRYIIWDSELKGFGLKVQPTGKKGYFIYYRTASGLQRSQPLAGMARSPQKRPGRSPGNGSPARSGKDVSHDRQEARSAPPIKDLAQRYLDEHAKPFKKPSSYKTDKSNLEHHVLPLIGTKKVCELARADVEYVKFSVREGKTAKRLRARRRGRCIVKGGPGAANRVVSLLSKIMACAIDWGFRTDNPAQRIRKYAERRKDRFLDLDEIRRLLEALRDAEAEGTETSYVIACFLLLLFTGLRRGEVLGLQWSDIDLERRVLKLRDTKTGARYVPINDHATSILMKLASDGNAGPVIRSAMGEGRPSLGKPWSRILRRAGIDRSARAVPGWFESRSFPNRAEL